MANLGTIILIGILILLTVIIFRRPFGCLLRLIINTIGGFIILFLFNFVGQFFGVTLSLGWFNAVIVGIFGLPGVGLLLILQWLFGISMGI
ncbi:MAG: pro-sigmaK processing inhibitor BofA family protein [Oscillospiraceae bacterium]|nr:pro-sigmaK processing inhibitor BofA family protein [Oscillospiraceae bacterium]